MRKISIISGILVFILVTIVVLSSDTTGVKKVQFNNQNLSMNNENPDMTNSNNVSVNLDKSKLANTGVNTSNKSISLQPTNTDYSTQNISNSPFSFSNSKNNINLQNYENQRNKLNNLGNTFNNRNVNYQNQQTNTQDKYYYENVDWSVWKSHFVNKIIDDSMYIHTLDDYPYGSQFYYSFYVDNRGNIYNINVVSNDLRQDDIQKITNLIKNYAHTSITSFPYNTRRPNIMVDAVVKLGSEEVKSSPSDFNDKEKVKVHYNF